MQNKNNLKYKWFAFKEAVLCPIPLFSLLGATILIALSVWQKDKVEFSTLINLIGSLLIGVSGAFIKSGYDELTQDSVLVKKGQSAVRNLNSIERQIIQIRKWIKLFSENKTAKRELGEIDRHLSTAEMNIASGLLDWIDIIPELQEKEKEMKNYKETLKVFNNEILKIKRESIKAGESKKKKLEKRMRDLEIEIEKLKEEKFDYSQMNNALSIGSLDAGHIYNIGDKICSNCGKSYKEELSFSNSPKTVTCANLCPNCRKLKI
jgi:hypothetical protein